MTDKAADKFFKKSISFPESLGNAAQERAHGDHGGNLSRYIQKLVEQDVKGDSTPLPEMTDPLVKLVGAWNPGFRQVITTWIERHSIDQSQFMANIVWEICQAALEDRDPHRFLREDFPAAAEDRAEYPQRNPRRAG